MFIECCAGLLFICMVVIISMKPRAPVLQSVRLLDQVRERIRYLHYSLGTEKTYLHWVTFFVRWHGRNGAIGIHAK